MRAILAFLKPPTALTGHERSLLMLLGAAFLVNQYDFNVLILALPEIQTSLGISEDKIGSLVATARLGALPALLIAAFADRIGRRRILLFTVAGFTVFSAASGLAQTPEQFMTAQFLARMFTATEEILSIVVIIEELNARSRGWGLGFFAAMGALGSGLAAAMYGQIDWIPYGWRALYLAAIVPLAFLVWLRRGLKETKRFSAYQQVLAGGQSDKSGLKPFVELITAYPLRAMILAAVVVPFWFQMSAAFVFTSKYLKEEHAYAPDAVAFLFIAGGALAILGNIVAGAASDRFGRRIVMGSALVVNAIAVIAFYNSSGGWLPMAWVLVLFSFFCIEVISSAIGGELFPTSHRSTASAIRLLLGMGAAVIGLSCESALYDLFENHARAISIMAPVALLSLIGVAFLPETSSRELEQIAPDPPA